MLTRFRRQRRRTPPIRHGRFQRKRRGKRDRENDVKKKYEAERGRKVARGGVYRQEVCDEKLQKENRYTDRSIERGRRSVEGQRIETSL